MTTPSFNHICEGLCKDLLENPYIRRTSKSYDETSLFEEIAVFQERRQ